MTMQKAWERQEGLVVLHTIPERRWRVEEKQIPSLRYGMEMEVPRMTMQKAWERQEGLVVLHPISERRWRVEEKQIPSLRYGMEM